MRISDWSSDVCSSDLKRAEQRNGKTADDIADGERTRSPLNRGQPAIDGDEARRFADALRGHGVIDERAGGEPQAETDVGVKRPARTALVAEIGRASCRERVCQYV